MKFTVIKKKVCEEFGITVEEFDGPCRFRNLVLARHRAWWLGFRQGYSYCALGRWSNRDHSTIVYGVDMEEFRISGKIGRYVQGRVARYEANKETRRAPSVLLRDLKAEKVKPEEKRLPAKAMPPQKPKIIKPIYREA